MTKEERTAAWKARAEASKKAFWERNKDKFPCMLVWENHLDICEHCRKLVRCVKFSGGLMTKESITDKCCTVGKPLQAAFCKEVDEHVRQGTI